MDIITILIMVSIVASTLLMIMDRFWNSEVKFSS